MIRKDRGKTRLAWLSLGSLDTDQPEPAALGVSCSTQRDTNESVIYGLVTLRMPDEHLQEGQERLRPVECPSAFWKPQHWPFSLKMISVTKTYFSVSFPNLLPELSGMAF